MLDKKFFTSLANAIRKDYVKHIFDNGKDVFGKKFKGYTKTYGQRKKNNEFRRQSSAFKNKTSPVLTGDFMNDCKPSSTKFSASVKWASFGGRVKQLANFNRKVTDDKQPFPKKIINMINSKVDKAIKNKFPKNKKVVIKLKK